ncbi:receptor protein EIX2 [Trifolium repens]|nr:receptor protein EIX2 [Trifolium repens]
MEVALLNFLGYLNLSCNNFHGKIPIGTQLQSFDASSFIGNPKLCGAPLNNCTTEEENPKNATSPENEDDGSIRESLYLGMGVGFAAGFWASDYADCKATYCDANINEEFYEMRMRSYVTVCCRIQFSLAVMFLFIQQFYII